MSFAHVPDWLQEDHVWVIYDGDQYHVDSWYITGNYSSDWVELNLSHSSIPGVILNGIPLEEIREAGYET